MEFERPWLVVFSHPSEKYERQLGWFEIPNINGKIKNGFQTTNQDHSDIQTYLLIIQIAGVQNASTYNNSGLNLRNMV